MDTYTATLEAQNEELKSLLAKSELWVPHWITYIRFHKVNWILANEIHCYVHLWQSIRPIPRIDDGIDDRWHVIYSEEIGTLFNKNSHLHIPVFNALHDAKQHAEKVLDALVQEQRKTLYDLIHNKP